MIESLICVVVIGMPCSVTESKGIITPKMIKSSLYLLYYAKACNKFVGLFATTLRVRNTAPLEEKLQRWRAIGNSASDLTFPGFEPLTSRTRTKHDTA